MTVHHASRAIQRHKYAHKLDATVSGVRHKAQGVAEYGRSNFLTSTTVHHQAQKLVDSKRYASRKVVDWLLLKNWTTFQILKPNRVFWGYYVLYVLTRGKGQGTGGVLSYVSCRPVESFEQLPVFFLSYVQIFCFAVRRDLYLGTVNFIQFSLQMHYWNMGYRCFVDII